MVCCAKRLWILRAMLCVDFVWVALVDLWRLLLAMFAIVLSLLDIGLVVCVLVIVGCDWCDMEYLGLQVLYAFLALVGYGWTVTWANTSTCNG